MKFRKKPVVIEAVKASDAMKYAESNWKGLPDWLRDAYEAGNVVFARPAVIIRTLEGNMTAEPKDWIIRGVKGEIYPCKPDIFAATYDAVDAPAVGGAEPPDGGTAN